MKRRKKKVRKKRGEKDEKDPAKGNNLLSKGTHNLPLLNVYITRVRQHTARWNAVAEKSMWVFDKCFLIKKNLQCAPTIEKRPRQELSLLRFVFHSAKGAKRDAHSQWGKLWIILTIVLLCCWQNKTPLFTPLCQNGFWMSFLYPSTEGRDTKKGWRHVMCCQNCYFLRCTR